MNLTFEQLEPALHKWSRHFQSEKYDHWELINVVWEKGAVQNLPDIRLASARIKWDMIDYMRDEENVRPKRKREAKGLFVPKTTSLSLPITGGMELMELIEDHKEPCGLDSEDFFSWLIKDLSGKSQLIVKLLYMKGFNQVEVSKVIGVTESLISSKLQDILETLRAKLLSHCPELNNKFGIVSRRPRNQSTESVRFYNRKYYLLNKKRISANKARRYHARKIA